LTECNDSERIARNEKERSDPADLLSKLRYYKERKNTNNRSNGMNGNTSNNENSREINLEYDLPDRLEHIRKPPTQQIESSFKAPLRNVADGIPEVHFAGEICKGYGFQNSSISCKWTIEWGKSFSLLCGDSEGQTQYSMLATDDKSCIWNHPVDVHFASAGMSGWPRIIVQLWELDSYGRTASVGYGFAHLPCTQGIHYVNIQCWRPQSMKFGEEMKSFYLGMSTQLSDNSIIFDNAWQNRNRLLTIHTGQLRYVYDIMMHQI